MEKGTREQNIKRIINMEDRIAQCNRCPSLTRCIRKPSLGKGDLEPQVLMVFECENQFTLDLEKVIHLRDSIKKSFSTERVYHTFMVRCQPKACTSRQNTNCFMTNKLLDRENICLLNSNLCEGIPVKPSSEEVMSCLPFLMEEIDVLKPDYVILFGQRVSEYVLKSYGLFDAIEKDKVFEYDKITFLITSEEKRFTNDEANRLSQLTHSPALR